MGSSSDRQLALDLVKSTFDGMEVPSRPEWKEIGASAFGETTAEQTRTREDAFGGTISFSTDWNHKLACQAFTTFRMFNPRKYRRGLLYEIALRGKMLGRARLVEVLSMSFSQITPAISYIDTGYDVDTFQKILKQMYSKTIESFGHSMWNLLILKWEERNHAEAR